MNKARIMLTAIAVFATVGGALAVKVKRIKVILTCTTATTTGTGIFAKATTTTNAIGKVYWTDVPAGHCINFSYTAPDQ